MQAVLDRKRAEKALKGSTLQEHTTDHQQLPNSAALSLIGNDGASASSSGLKEKLVNRISGVTPHMQEQIPQAESEADRLSASVTSGSPEAVKAAMGQKLGADFSGVRFHMGHDAAARAEAMGARAFTSGADVYFGEGGFDASVAAHELVHTAQQGMVASSVPTMSAPLGGVQMKKKTRKEEYGESFGEASARRFKNIGHLISGTGRHAKDFVVGKARSVQRKHQRAVDQLNNNRADYNDMSLWERFKWSAKNPLARVSAWAKKDDTEARNAENAKIDQKAQEIAANTTYDLGDAGYDPRADEYYNATLANEKAAAEAAQSAGGDAGAAVAAPAKQEKLNEYGETIPGKQEVFDHIAGDIVRNKVLGIGHKGGMLAGKALGAPATSARKISDAIEAKQSIDLDGVDQAFGSLGGIAGGGASFARAGANLMRTIDAVKTGNLTESLRSGGSMATDVAGGAANVAKGISYLARNSGAVEVLGTDVIPGINIAAGGIKFAGGTTDTVRGLQIRSRMKERMAAMKNDHEAGNLNRDEERYYRTLEQAKRMASVRAVGGGFDMASGAMKMGGGVATLAGAGAPVGAALSGASAVTNITKGLVTDAMKKSRREDVVEEELQLKEKMSALERQGYSQRDAKHLVLKSMGFSSGKRKEAFQHITMKRATELHKKANAGDKDTRKLMKELGVHKVFGKYSLQGISEKLGMDSGLTWQTQMDNVAHSRDKNMFKHKADEKRASVEKEKAKKRAEQEKKLQKQQMKMRKQIAIEAAEKARKKGK